MDKSAASTGYISNLGARDSFSKGWALLKSNFLKLLGITLIVTVISTPAQLDSFSSEPDAAYAAIGFIWSIFVMAPLAVGVGWTFLKAVREEEFEITDIFDVFKRNYLNALVASILSGIFIFVGFLLFIIPGIYFAIKLSFVGYLIMDKDMEAMDAIKTSWKMTSGHAWTLFRMFLISIFVLILGLLALIVGVVVSMTLLSATYAVFYHSVSKKRVEGEEQGGSE